MSLRERITNLAKEIIRDTSRNVIGHTINKFANSVVNAMPGPKPKPKTPTGRFRLMLVKLVELDEDNLDEHVRGAAKHLLDRGPPEYLCYDFLATLETMPDEDVNPLVKGMFNVKAQFPRPPAPK
jgi:hypothetical protein